MFNKLIHVNTSMEYDNYKLKAIGTLRNGTEQNGTS